MKAWYASKTLWVNLIAGLAFLVQAQYGFILDPEAQAAILAVINIILRAVTGTAIEWKASPPGEAGFIRLRLMAVMLALCLALGAVGCSTFKPPTMQQETTQAAQQNAQTIVMGFQAAFKASPPIFTALVQNGTISVKTFNNEILPAYNRGLASLAVVVAALQAAQDAQQDPMQTQAYTVALARFLTDKAVVDNMLTAFGGGAK